MKGVDLLDEKMVILKYIISIDDIAELNKIKDYIEQIHKELAAKGLLSAKSFNVWNKQFVENKNLNEPIAEYGTTLGEFRKMIFESEQGESFPIEEFQEKLKKIYNEP